MLQLLKSKELFLYDKSETSSPTTRLLSHKIIYLH